MLPANFTPIILRLVISTFTLGYTLVSSVGILPLMRGLLYFRRLIRDGVHNLEQAMKNGVPANPHVLEGLAKILLPHWADLMKSPPLFNRIINILIFAFSFGMFKPFLRLTLFIIRTTVGAIVSAVGILWNEYLQGYELLRAF